MYQQEMFQTLYKKIRKYTESEDKSLYKRVINMHKVTWRDN